MKRLEIIIVVIVVGILGWITWNQFDLAKKKARDIERRSNLHEISKVIKLYYADYGKLPPVEEINSLWGGKQWLDGNYVYVEKMPGENYTDQQYCYKTYGDGETFGLLANLENKNDEACKGNSFECGGKIYCFEDKMSANVEIIN
jgi:Tfp pilus assembly protein PilE